MKLDPTNTELLAQKTQIFAKQLETAKEKLKALKDIQERVTQQFKNGEIGEEAYRAFQREVAFTESNVKKLDNQLNEANKTTASVSDSTDNLSESIDNAGNETKELGKEVEKSESKLEKFGEVAKTVGKMAAAALAAVGTAAAAVSVKLGKEVISAYSDYEQLVGGVDTLFKDSSQKLQQYAANAYKTSGLSANEYMETVTSFSASLISSLGGNTDEAVKYADMAITDMSDNANKMGTDMSAIQNAYQGFAKQNYTMLDNLKLGYGGTKEEMERLLADAEKISGVKYDLSSYADVVNAIHVIQTSMDITGTTAKEAEHTISGSVNSAKSAVQNLLVGFGDANADIDKLCGNVVDAVNSVIENITPVIENIISALPTAASALLKTVGKLLPTLIKTITKLFSQVLKTVLDLLPSLIPATVEAVMIIVDTLIENLPALVEMGVQFITSLIQGIGDALPTLIPTAVQAIITIVQGLIDNLPMILDAALKLIEGLAQGIIKALPVLIDALPKLIKSIVDFILKSIPQIIDAGIELLTALVDALPTIIDRIVEVLPEIISGIIDALLDNLPAIVQAGIDLFIALVNDLPFIITTIVDAIPEIIDKVIDALMDSIPQLIDAGVKIFIALVENLPAIIKGIVSVAPKIISSVITALIKLVSRFHEAGVELFSALIHNLPQIIQNIVSKIPEIIQRIVEAFQKLIGEMADIGKKMIEGLWDGIKSMGGWLGDRCKDFGDTWMSGFKSIFGIHSPSRLFRDEIGKNLALGIGIGFTDNMEKVTKDMQKALPTSFDIDPEITGINKKASELGRTVSNVDQRIVFSFNVENFTNHSDKDLRELMDYAGRYFAAQVQRRENVF